MSPPPIPRPFARRWTLLLCLALGACADAERAPQERPIDLLRRQPDAWLDQPGTLVADLESGFGELGVSGWEERAERAADGTPVVWTKTRVARLRLPAGPARDRTLALTACRAVPLEEPPPLADGRAPRCFVRVRLNGVELGQVYLEALARHEVEAPAAAWRYGENLLELEVNHMVLARTDAWLGFGLAQLDYDRPIGVHVDTRGRRLTLEHDGGATYRVELVARTRLALRGTSAGPGTLYLHLASVDVETGAVSHLSPEPMRLEARGGTVETELTLPDVDGGLLEVQLHWLAGGAERAPLEIARLEQLESDPPERTPIVFISIDTLAARHMSVFGYARETTPNLGELAAEAVRFTSCKSNAPRTLRSYISQLSGLYPRSHFVENRTRRRWRPPVEKDQLAPNRWTLAEMLRAAGYRTAAWVDNPWLVNGIGLDQGFDTYDVSASELDHWGEAFDPDGGIRHIVPLVEAWLDELEEGEPFFAFLQALDVHGPYLPVEPWKGRFREDGLYDPDHVLPVAGGQLDVFGRVPDYIVRPEHPDELPAEVHTAPLIAAYDEKILELDATLGAFFDRLRARGLYDRSILVLSADHGESLIEHDFYFGHGTVYEENVNVPLMIRLPGGEHGGRVVRTPVELVDLYPTLAELAGIRAERPYLHGRSLVPALEGAELEVVPLMADGGVMSQVTLQHGDWKLIELDPGTGSFQTMLSHPRVDSELLDQVPGVREAMGSNRELQEFFSENPKWYVTLRQLLGGPTYELYDLAEDPLELNDLAQEEPGRVAELRAMLEAKRERVAAAQRNAAPVASHVELTEESIEELRNLGYLEDEEPPGE